MWIGKVTTPGHIESTLTNLNKAVIGSFEKACPRCRISGCKKVPWWNPELTLLKKKANKAFHVAYRTRTEDDWLQHWKVRREFKKVIRRCNRESWRSFCACIEGVPESARLKNIFVSSPRGKLGMLRRPNGRWTESSEEMIQHLLETFSGMSVGRPTADTYT